MTKRHYLLAAIMVLGIALAGCGSAAPDEKKLHEELKGPPMRPKSAGVGKKKFDETHPGGDPGANPPATSTTG